MKARDIDILLGTPARLAIMASLTGGGPLTFTQLRQETGLADGNLHVQARRLIDAGYVDAGKTRAGKRTLTRFESTDRGRERYQAHVRMISRPLGRTRFPVGTGEPGRATASGARNKDDSQVW